MSFDNVKEAYAALEARIPPMGAVYRPEEEIPSFVPAVCRFIEALAATGLYSKLKERAEYLVDCVARKMRARNDISFRAHWWEFRVPKHGGEALRLCALVPFLSDTYISYIFFNGQFPETDQELNAAIGNYLLHVCYISGALGAEKYVELEECIRLLGTIIFFPCLHRTAYDWYYQAWLRSEPRPFTSRKWKQSDGLPGDSAPEVAQTHESREESCGEKLSAIQTCAPVQDIEGTAVNTTLSPGEVNPSAPANTADDEAQSDDEAADKAKRKRWLEAQIKRPKEQPPEDYYGDDYLEGTKISLSLALNTNSTAGDPKVFERAVESGQVWVRRISGQTWHMFFPTPDALERGREKRDNKMAEKGKTGQKTPKKDAVELAIEPTY
jgi:hypothetical protein